MKKRTTRMLLTMLLSSAAALTASSQTAYIHQGGKKTAIPIATLSDMRLQNKKSLKVGKKEIRYTSIDSITFADDETYLLFSKKAAPSWDYGYGVGNGRLGILSYGDFPKETLVLNESSIYAGTTIKPRPDIDKYIRLAREYCKERKYYEANEIFKNKIVHTNDISLAMAGSYQPGGILSVEYIDMPSKANDGYERRLNMLSGTGSTKVRLSDGTTVVTSYMSVPECIDVIAYRMITDRKEGVNVSFQLGYPGKNAKSVSENDSTIVLTGQCSNGGTRFENLVRIITKGGKKTMSDGKLIVTGASEILLLSSIATDYNIAEPDKPLTTILRETNNKHIATACNYTWSEMHCQTTAHFAPLLSRCSIDLGTTPDGIRSMGTDERLARLKDKTNSDPDLVEKLFQFGRFCVVASSRPGGLPSGLQGLWNPDMTAKWRGCYYLNINCQMNYWCTEMTNLGEYHQPFLDLVIGLQKGGEEFAKWLGYDGFCFGLHADVWRKTYFRGQGLENAPNLMAGAWATAHLVDHYRYSGDMDMLRRSYPILESNARFIMDWFYKDSVTNKYISGPGASPENYYSFDHDGKKVRLGVSNGVTIDQELGIESLSNFLYACKVLGIDNEYSQRAEKFLPQIELPGIGKDGRLKEWREEFEEYDPAHRHFSHCYGLFPGNSIDFLNTKELYEAARKSIDRRIEAGGAATGWSRAWAINFYAMLHDGNKTYDQIKNLMQSSMNPNLFDMHPPFQIDGNFGVVSGIASCIVQSQTEYKGKRIIEIAPAIASQWSKGEAKGLTTRGGLTVDISWSGSSVTAKVTASRDIDCQLYCKNKFTDCKLKAGKSKTYKF